MVTVYEHKGTILPENLQSLAADSERLALLSATVKGYIEHSMEAKTAAESLFRQNYHIHRGRGRGRGRGSRETQRSRNFHNANAPSNNANNANNANSANNANNDNNEAVIDDVVVVEEVVDGIAPILGEEDEAMQEGIQEEEAPQVVLTPNSRLLQDSQETIVIEPPTEVAIAPSNSRSLQEPPAEVAVAPSNSRSLQEYQIATAAINSRSFQESQNWNIPHHYLQGPAWAEEETASVTQHLDQQPIRTVGGATSTAPEPKVLADYDPDEDDKSKAVEEPSPDLYGGNSTSSESSDEDEFGTVESVQWNTSLEAGMEEMLLREDQPPPPGEYSLD